MAHKEQIVFCTNIQNKFPEFFSNKFVLDIGSLDVNGNNGYLFKNCLYIGVDIATGKNVDIVSKGHELAMPDHSLDCIISTECFEHDQYYAKTLKNIMRMLKPGGLFIFTCATTGRAEHGTRRTSPQDAPLLQDMQDWGDYYKNLDENDIREVLDIETLFKQFEFSSNDISHDLYFYGIKEGDLVARQDYSFLLHSAHAYDATEYLNIIINLQDELHRNDEYIFSLSETIRSAYEEKSALIEHTKNNIDIIERKYKEEIANINQKVNAVQEEKTEQLKLYQERERELRTAVELTQQEIHQLNQQWIEKAETKEREIESERKVTAQQIADLNQKVNAVQEEKTEQLKLYQERERELHNELNLLREEFKDHNELSNKKLLENMLLQNHLYAEINQMTTSISWRITKPLRIFSKNGHNNINNGDL
jgi:SAM-dependent methyltransferase